MKMKKGIILIICVSAQLLRSQPLQAQFGAGFAIASYGILDYYPVSSGNGRMLTPPGDNSGLFYPDQGLVIRTNGFYRVNRRMRLNLAFDYFFQNYKTATSTDSLGMLTNNLYDITIDDPQIAVRADFQYSFKNDLKGNPFAIYGLAGFSANAIFYDVIYGQQPNPYTEANIAAEEKQTYYGTAFNLGFGCELQLPHYNAMYLEVRGCTGANAYFTKDDLDHFRYLPHNFNPAYVLATVGFHKDFKRQAEE